MISINQQTTKSVLTLDLKNGIGDYSNNKAQRITYLLHKQIGAFRFYFIGIPSTSTDKIADGRYW